MAERYAVYTLAIVGAIVFIACSIYDHVTYSPSASRNGLVALIVCMALAAFSGGYSERIVPEEYTKIENYSYVTEDGGINTIEGPFYEANGIYYQQKMGKSFWVPFAPCEFVEVDFPKFATADNPDATNQCPNCGFTCATPFCGNCGTEID